MLSIIKKKMNQKIFGLNINRGIYNVINALILVILILPKVSENRIIKSGLYSITAKFKKSSSISQRILNCGNEDFYFHNDIFTYPEKIRINNGIKENYSNDDIYNLTEEENTVEYFWEDVIITNCAMIFYKCENIIEIDFSNFNTSNVNSTRQMFFGCINLKSLNLSNFDTSKVIYMIEMFYNCYSLTSLDLSNFNTSQVFHSYDSIRGGMFYMFYNCSSLVSLNLFNFQITFYIDNIFYKCESLSYINFGNATIENEYIISELNKISSPNLCIIINNEILNFFNSLNVAFNFFFQLYDPHDQNTETILNCSSLLEDLSTYYITNSETDLISNTYILDLLNSTGVEEIINTTNYVTELKNTYLENINTNSSLIIDSTYHLINSESNLIVNSNSIKNLNNYTFIKDKNELLKKIREYLLNGKFNININGEFYYKFKEDNMIIELSNTEKEKNKERNETAINFGNCEFILKNEYNISNNSYLYIFKIDIKEEGYKIPIIFYEVYFPFNDNNITQLDLKFCEKEKIELSIPVAIEEDLEKYNSTSDYYNDICSIATSKSGTDISIKDRRDEFTNNNMTLCEGNCKLIDYDYKTEKAKCSCHIKINIPFLSDDMLIIKNRDDLLKSFTNINNIVNINLMKCYAVVLRIKSLKDNYGSYIILFIILLYLICLILFYINNNFFLLKVQINFISNEVINSLKIIKNVILDKNVSNIINSINNKYKSKNSGTFEYLKPKFFSKKENTNFEFTDSELNELSYEKALKKDKRTYFQYYISLLRTKHLFIFCFFVQNDYNSQIIKRFLFFFFFSVYLSVNALFFNDDTMHKIYIDEGKFNFIFQLPQIIGSVIISVLINAIIKKLALTSNDIIELKKEKNIDKIKYNKKKY